MVQGQDLLARVSDPAEFNYCIEEDISQCPANTGTPSLQEPKLDPTNDNFLAMA